MKKALSFVVLLFLTGLCGFSQGQNPPFWEEIQEFKKEDSLQPPPQQAILFTGSSSFRMWKNVQQAFPQHTIINRGFGGSSLPHVIRYADDLIFPYNPKQVVLYCGENDLAASDTLSAQTVYQRFRQLFALVREQLPQTPFVFISIKPSPSRAHLMPKMKEANHLIQTFLKKQPNTKFVDVFPDMLGRDGQPRKELFLDDQLHMNEKGYAIWQKKLEPVLIRD